MSIVINKAAVRRALEQWFIAARAGETLSARETAELSAADAAAQSSDLFYDLLVKDEDSVQVEVSTSTDLESETFDIGTATIIAQAAIPEGSEVVLLNKDDATKTIYVAPRPPAAEQTDTPDFFAG